MEKETRIKQDKFDHLLKCAQEYVDEQTIKMLPEIIAVKSKMHNLIEAIHSIRYNTTPPMEAENG